MADKPLAQQYYEKVETLKSKGMKQADAIRQVAQELGKNEQAVRGGIHQYKAKLDGARKVPSSDGQRAPKTKTFDSYMNQAREILETARAVLEADVREAQANLDAAQNAYNDAVRIRDEKLIEVDAKLKALA